MAEARESSIAVALREPTAWVGIVFGIGVTLWVETLSRHIGDLQDYYTCFQSIEFSEIDEAFSKIEYAYGVKCTLFLISEWFMEAWVSKLVGGVFFLVDILCIIWWYARYIHRIRPVMNLWMYFLDFSVAGTFSLAANHWNDPFNFVIASSFGGLLLIVRFMRIYRDPLATETDRHILRQAVPVLLVGLIAALVASSFYIPAVLDRSTEPSLNRFIYDRVIDLDLVLDKFQLQADMEMIRHIAGAFVTFVLSVLGIGLTIWLRPKIAGAVNIHDRLVREHKPMSLEWTRSMSVSDQNAISAIRKHAEKGLEDFGDLFRGKSWPEVFREIKEMFR